MCRGVDKVEGRRWDQGRIAYAAELVVVRVVGLGESIDSVVDVRIAREPLYYRRCNGIHWAAN